MAPFRNPFQLEVMFRAWQKFRELAMPPFFTESRVGLDNGLTAGFRRGVDHRLKIGKNLFHFDFGDSIRSFIDDSQI